jgi:hypothetical protein
MSPASRTCSVKRICRRSLSRDARMRASNVALRAIGSSAGVQSTTLTVAASAAAGQASSRRRESRARRIDAPLTPSAGPELR